MKKISLFLLSLLGILFLSSCSSGNIEECFMTVIREEDGEKFAIITKYNFDNPKCSMDVVIPEEIDGAPVKIIDWGAFKNPYWSYKLSNKKLPSIHKKFRELECNFSAYFKDSQECRQLANDLKPNSELRLIKSVSIPESVEKIGGEVFVNNLLTEISFWKNIKEIGIRSFLNNNLQSISIHPDAEWLTVGRNAFFYNDLETVELPYGTTFAEHEDSPFNSWVETSFK